MILEQLAKICHEIRYTEAIYEKPSYLKIDSELDATTIAHKAQREIEIAKTLYRIVKEYALTKEPSE